MTTEAVLSGVPVLALVAHLPLVDAYGLAARVTVLGEHGVEAVQTERPAVTHDVALAAELSFTFRAGKVFHMPGSALCLCALISQDNL